jgi:hypothetical protein
VGPTRTGHQRIRERVTVPRAGKALPAVYVAGVGAVSTPSSAALCFARRVVARRLKRRAVAEAAEAREHDGPQLMRCTRDILCSQPEHLISRQIRARTVRDEPARAWTGAIRIFGSVM